MRDGVLLVLGRGPSAGALVANLFVPDGKSTHTGSVIVPRDQLRRVAREFAQVADAQGVPP